MIDLPITTGCRLLMQERSGTTLKSISLFADGSGGLYKVMTVTFHFENGTWFSERTFPGTWDGADVWEETDTDYDPFFNGGTDGSGYGNSVDPYETYAFSQPVTESDAIAEGNATTPTMGAWTGVAEIATNSLPEAHEHSDGTTINEATGVTSFVVTKTDNVEAGPGGWAVEVIGVEAQFVNAGPMPCKLFYQSSPAAATTQALSAGASWTAPAAGRVNGEHHDIRLTAIQWLPWAT